MRIDAFSHVLPESYRQAVLETGDFSLRKLWTRVEALSNVRLRLEVMEETSVDQQVLTLAVPPLEALAAVSDPNRLATLANDGMAEIVRDHPDRFIGVGSVSLADPEAASAELSRCTEELGLVGVMLYSNIDGRPLDAERFDEFFGTVEDLDVPVWLHPFRPDTWADYPVENESKYLLWQSLGWPIDTTMAMARLVFGGVLARHPGLKIIVHHAGALIPALAHRITTLYRPEVMRGTALAPGVEPPYIDWFRRFYVDTVVTSAGVEALRTSLGFFGTDHVLFGTDAPFGLEQGREFTNLATQAVADLNVDSDQIEKIWSGNLIRLLGDRSVGTGSN